MADADKFGLLGGDSVHYSEGSVLVDWLGALGGQHGEYLERRLNVDDLSVDLVKFTEGLGGLELNALLLLGQLRLNEGQEEARSLLVDGSVGEERPFDESDELALDDGGVELLLGQLVQQLEAGHVVVLLHLEQKEEGLVLDVAIARVVEFVLELVHGLFGDLGGVALLLEKVDVRNHGCTDDVGVLVDQSLSQELFYVLHILLINDLGQHSQSICLIDIIIRELNILSQTTDYNENLTFADI